MSADDATLDDIATAVATARVLAVRLEALSSILVDDDPTVRAGWGDALDEMRERVVRDGNALFYAHQRETGAPPAQYLSTQPARRCNHEVMDWEASQAYEAEMLTVCGRPSGWRFLYPDDASAVYACEMHEDDLRRNAEAAGARVERLPS